MKKPLLILLCLPILVLGQSVYSKDNVKIGNKSDLVRECVLAAEETIIIDQMEVNSKSYCSCVFDELIPALYSWDIEEAINNNSIEELFTNDNNFEILYNCAKENITLNDSYSFGYKRLDEYTDVEIAIAVKSCVLEAEEDQEVVRFFSKNQITT
jgi:hypothetical protein